MTCRNHWHGTHVAFCNLCKRRGLYRSKSNIVPFVLAQRWILWRPYKIPKVLRKPKPISGNASSRDDLKFWKVWILTNEVYHESGASKRHVFATNSLLNRNYKVWSSTYVSNLVSPKMSSVTWQSSASLCFRQMCLRLYVRHKPFCHAWSLLHRLSQFFWPLLGRSRSRGRCWAAIRLSHRPEPSGPDLDN